MSNIITPISPQVFWNEFSKFLKKDYDDDTSDFLLTYLKNPEGLTEKMTSLVEKVGQKLELPTHREYWPRVDVSFFSHTTENWDEWSWEVAIEIENNTVTWTEELCKLMVINAGLKVLITYYNDGQEDYVYKTLKEFEQYYKSRKYHQTNDNYLIILGNYNHDSGKLTFKAQVFDGIKLTNLDKITLN